MYNEIIEYNYLIGLVNTRIYFPVSAIVFPIEWSENIPISVISTAPQTLKIMIKLNVMHCYSKSPDHCDCRDGGKSIVGNGTFFGYLT